MYKGSSKNGFPKVRPSENAAARIREGIFRAALKFLGLCLLASGFLFSNCSAENKDPSTEDNNTENADSIAKKEFEASMVMGQYGCLGCHSVDGSKFRGPSFKGLYGSEVVLNNGKKIIADEEYIRNSIREPNSQIPDGYMENLMPKFDIKDKELELILFYIKRLSQN